MPFKGVLISWLIVAKNSIFAISAADKSTFVCLSSSSKSLFFVFNLSISAIISYLPLSPLSVIMASFVTIFSFFSAGLKNRNKTVKPTNPTINSIAGFAKVNRINPQRTATIGTIIIRRFLMLLKKISPATIFVIAVSVYACG